MIEKGDSESNVNNKWTQRHEPHKCYWTFFIQSSSHPGDRYDNSPSQESHTMLYWSIIKKEIEIIYIEI